MSDIVRVRLEENECQSSIFTKLKNGFRRIVDKARPHREKTFSMRAFRWLLRAQESLDPSVRIGGGDAEFLGWQKTKHGEVFALYNITATTHPLFGSTVTVKTLRTLNIQIPPTPNPETPKEVD